MLDSRLLSPYTASSAGPDRMVYVYKIWSGALLHCNSLRGLNQLQMNESIQISRVKGAEMKYPLRGLCN